MLTEFHMHSMPGDALRLRYTKAEIAEAVAANLARVKKVATETEAKLTAALAKAKCDAPREKLTELAETAFDLSNDLDETACDILNAVRLLQPLGEVARMLELVGGRLAFAHFAVHEDGSVLLTGSDYQTLIRAFDVRHLERGLLGPQFRPMRRMGIGTALVRRHGPAIVGGYGPRATPIGVEDAPSSINDLLKPGGSDGA